MLADFLEKLLDLTRLTMRVEARHEVLPDKVLIASRDTWDFIDVPPPRRKHLLASLTDLLAMAALFQDSELFHGEQGIALVTDGQDRREVVFLPLATSARWGAVRWLEEPRRMAPREAVRFLRHSLSGTGVEAVARALSRLDFSRRSDGKTIVEHGRESLGKSVEAVVQQAAEVPESFTISVAIYNTEGVLAGNVVVECGIYLDVENQAVQLQMLPDECARAMQNTQRRIGDQLRGMLGHTRIYHGEFAPAHAMIYDHLPPSADRPATKLVQR